MKGHLIPINSVEADEGGVFVRSGNYVGGRCPGCGWPLILGICHNFKCHLSPFYDPNY
jgi:hypothetical protein